MIATKLYTSERGTQPLWELLNEALKSDHQEEIEPWLPYLQLFRAEVEWLPLYKRGCWRGTNNAIGNKFQVGHTVTWQGISSCSKSLDFILQHCVGTSGTLIKIDVINGRDISNITHDHITQEVILMPGTTLIVKSVKPWAHNSNITFVELEEIVDKKRNEIAQTASKLQASSFIDHDNAPSSKSNHGNFQNTMHANSDHRYTLIHRLTDVDCENRTLKPIKSYQNSRNITLEDALKPIRNAIPHLDDYIQKVKRRVNTSFSNSLTIDESAAIYLYTMQLNDISFSRMLNEALRYEDQTEVKNYWFNYLELILSALKKLPSIRGHVYQGVTRRIKENYPKKKIITWWGITSCTQTPDNLVSSLLDKKSTLLNIKILNGKDISTYSCKNNEIEIILLPGTRLRVNNVSYNVNLGIDEIDLEEINDEMLQLDTTSNHTKKRISKDGSSNKIWLECRFKDPEGTTIIKPDECELNMTEPSGNIDRHILNRIMGSMFGLILGDALGAHVEFRPHSYLLANPVTDLRGGGTWGLEKGQFTDDGSMTLCLANSLVARRGFEPYDQLVRYKWWFRHGYMSSTGTCFDVGESTRKALCIFEDRQKIFAQKHGIPLEEIDFLSDEQLLKEFSIFCSPDEAAGNGVLMRLAPVPLFFYQNPQAAVKFSGISGRITHGDKKAFDACRYYGALIVATMHNADKDQLLSEDFYLSKMKTWFTNNPLDSEIENIAKGSFKKENGYDSGIRGTGYVANSLEAALWAFWSTHSFEEGVLAAVNLGDDTDTTAAIYGQLAGAYYGYDKLPQEWINSVYSKCFIECLCKWIAYEGNQLCSKN
ncbi:unnamed protein product [Rotaria sordida]|uniref:NAD(P)(+)--arginine ADP-ribosyltransferase n=1 Tax=Rotaria sordida TaxID=392033 RepID=A0A815ACX6_9BILA|nr:unnamed protein product [Rotaria sordida]